MSSVDFGSSATGAEVFSLEAAEGTVGSSFLDSPFAALTESPFVVTAAAASAGAASVDFSATTAASSVV